jgi:serine/threonine-protein kinase
VASTQPYPHFDDVRATTEMAAAPDMRTPSELASAPSRPAALPDGTLDTLASATSDLDAVTGELSTGQAGRPWSDDGGADADTSHGGSVVFDPDILAREQRRDSRPAQHAHRPELGDVEERLADFAMEPTTPGLPSSRSSPSSDVTSSSGPTTVYRHGNDGIVAVGRVIANRYRIDALIGTGAVGAVYRASHVELPRTFALKVLHPHFRADPHLLESFRTEARAASLLDHPNVTIVHDFGEEPDGIVYIVMEYLNGSSLQALLDEQRRVEPRRAIELMIQVCAALAAAHERGIVHRDIKPDNIMLVHGRDDEGRTVELVKVCDFGIAALEAAPGASAAGWTAGTPEYMAPEQARGRSDARTDVYACGIVLYEMLAGRPPFVGDSPSSTLAKHASEPPRRPSELVPGLSPHLEALILRAIDKAPERRFSTMRELRGALKRLLLS